ncbi:MAG TPA: DUF2062 domain-containing protein [Vicinamibacterales bacterium]
MAFEATLDTLYRWADKALRLDDTPPRLALALAWGVTAGFSPFFGVQYAVAFLVAFVLRLNKLLVLAGLCLNLPWIMVPWYAGTTAIAGALLGVPLPDDLRGAFGTLFSEPILSLDFWRHLFRMVRPWVLPFLLGPTVGAVLLGAATYPVALALMRARSRQREAIRGSEA